MLRLIYPFQVSLPSVRAFSTSLIRNIGIIAHVDAGKTTTTEKLILSSGLIRRAGSVDTGDTVMDYLPEERERGITINAAAITIPWRGHRINIIDTPGHVDFTVEVERALRVLDGVIVILDYTKGIQAQTLTVWRQAERYNLPKIIFLNKVDKGGPNDKCLLDIEKVFGLKPVLLNEPIFVDGKIREVVPSKESEIIETLCENDQELLEKFIENDTVSEQDIFDSLKRSKGEVIPVLHGAASIGMGITPLLDSIVNILPSPIPSAEKEFSALAFKTVYDPARNGFLNYFRVYSGQVSGKRTDLYNVNKRLAESGLKLMQVMADELIPIQEAQTGDIVVITGLKNTATGDTLSSHKHAKELPGLTLPTPVIGFSIEAESLSDQERLDEALRIVQLEDPSVAVAVDSETGQTILQGMGELHLEIVQKRLKNELKAKFSSGSIQIGYKEVIKKDICASTTQSIDKDIFGVKIVGSITVELSTRADMNEIQFVHVDGSVARYVEDGVLSAFSRGPNSGFPVEKRAKIKIKSINYNSPEACRTLAFEATKQLLQQAGTKVFEPVVSVELEAPNAYIGTITGDLFSSRSCIEFSEQESKDEMKRLIFTAPLQKMLGYSTWLRSQTSGTGSFVMQPCGYAEHQQRSNNKRTPV